MHIPLFITYPRFILYLLHPLLHLGAATLIVALLWWASSLSLWWLSAVPLPLAVLFYFTRRWWRQYSHYRRRALWLEEDFVP